jgi:hypothetical protein
MPSPADRNSSLTVLCGRHGDVAFAVLADDRAPAKEFFDGLLVGEKAKFSSLFQAITDNPNLQLFNRQQFKHLEGDLFEFKRNDIKMRIFAFREGRCWYLVSGLRGKKEDQLPPRVVDEAIEFVKSAKSVLRKMR